MENNELRSLLTKLHEEIKNTNEVDEKGIELLRSLETDIAALLERSDDDPEPLQPTVFTNLEDAVTHFEVTHPTLTEQVAKISAILSGAGI
ncbi:MAG TPA: DUF4404 domain-containing protein [Anaerolineaceae bacterium]|nr:DUF4404 domain-containing protein [Anaerolineaceae bacterium]